MAGNSEITTNKTSYIQRFGSNDGGRDIAPPRRSTRLNTMATTKRHHHYGNHRDHRGSGEWANSIAACPGVINSPSRYPSSAGLSLVYLAHNPIVAHAAMQLSQAQHELVRVTTSAAQAQATTAEEATQSEPRPNVHAHRTLGNPC
ncbi:hypothetical protein ACFXTO_038726 [Malus domestica]